MESELWCIADTRGRLMPLTIDTAAWVSWEKLMDSKHPTKTNIAAFADAKKAEGFDAVKVRIVREPKALEEEHD